MDVASQPIGKATGARILTVLGLAQILGWGSTYYLMAVLAKPIARDTHWAPTWVVAGLSLGLLVAGLVSPHVGDAIHRIGGRPVLATSSALFALGLVGLAFSPNLIAYVASWLVIGAGMGAGLYDAAFATLGRLFGKQAHTAIATLTLFGGFASTVCWPLSAHAIVTVGWRNTCLFYAGIHLAVLLPLYVFALPKEPTDQPADRGGASDGGVRRRTTVPAELRLAFVLIAVVVTISSMISTLLSVHLLGILQARGVSLVTAVRFGAMVGPSQVAARAIEMLISRYHHPIWTKLASTSLVALGVGLLWSGAVPIACALVLYGAGIGIESIARGTLPLAVFGERNYPAIIGRIAMPSLILQAAAPSIGALLVGRFGALSALGVVLAVGVVNVALAAVLMAALPRGKRLTAP